MYGVVVFGLPEEEAAQVAAMGLRFLIDLAPEDIAGLPCPPSSARVAGSR